MLCDDNDDNNHAFQQFAEGQSQDALKGNGALAGMLCDDNGSSFQQCSDKDFRKDFKSKSNSLCEKEILLYTTR